MNKHDSSIGKRKGNNITADNKNISGKKIKGEAKIKNIDKTGQNSNRIVPLKYIVTDKDNSKVISNLINVYNIFIIGTTKSRF